MDLILDSNVYLSDIRMESIKFKNLFDYLRRTKSTLVLPRLVREETVAKHRRLLEIQARKAAKEVDQLNRLAVDKSSKTRMAMPNMRSASRSLRAKLMAPAKGVAVRYYPETAGVDVGDIFIRGVHRRRPASNEGEELRDVILWLITIQLAKSEQKQVALVTADKGFWTDTEVHPDIRKDIDKSKVNVLLFRTLEDFIRSSAPTPQPVNEEDVSKVFDLMTISSSIIEVIKKSLSNWKQLSWQTFTIRSVEFASAKLFAGAAYEINADTKLLELLYDVIVLTELVIVDPPQASQQGLGRIYGFEPPSIFQFGRGRVPLSVLMAEQNYIPFLQQVQQAKESAPPKPPTIATYAVFARAQVSVRLTGGALTEAELDGVEILKVEETSKAKVIEPTVEPALPIEE